MDKIILGLLMLKKFTAYELRNIIRQNYSSMCSDSLGSIQVALKKLFSADLVICTEFVEKGVNKKQYSITDLGRKQFMEWLKTPIDTSKTKNMDLSKLLRMGLVPSEERVALINEIISSLEKELHEFAEMVSLEQNTEENPYEKKLMLDYYENNQDYSLGIQNATQNSNMSENIDQMNFFGMATIQLGIDTSKFYLEWFTKLRDNILSSEL